MEEIEALLVSVKAWASKLLEALGLCRSDCEGLKGDKAALEIELEKARAEIVRLTELASTSFPTSGPPPVVLPESSAFDLAPILAWMTEFKELAKAIQNDVNARASELSGTVQSVGKGTEIAARIDQLDLYIKARADGLSAGQNDLASSIASVGDEIRVALTTTLKDMNRSSGEVSDTIRAVREQLTAFVALVPTVKVLNSMLDDMARAPKLDPGSVNDFMAYVKGKLQRLPF